MDNYAKVMELKFEVDDFISVGSYPINILDSSYYVKDYMSFNPVVLSGYVVVEEVQNG